MSTDDATKPAEATHRRRIGPNLFRWLHIYVSMGGLAATLFFSVTGLTLNHPDWMFGSARSEQTYAGQLDTAWFRVGAAEAEVAKLEVVEALRAAHGVRGAVEEFRIESNELVVGFKGPGSSADFFIDRRNGRYEAEAAYEGLVAVMNDLHKGRHTGTVWAWVIDISAVILVIVSLTGLGLLVYIRRRRFPGMWVAIGGLSLLGLVYWLGMG